MVHHTVAMVIIRCCDDGVEVKVADFGEKVEDLNNPQRCIEPGRVGQGNFSFNNCMRL